MVHPRGISRPEILLVARFYVICQLQSLPPRYLHRLNAAVVSASIKFVHKLDAEVSDRS